MLLFDVATVELKKITVNRVMFSSYDWNISCFSTVHIARKVFHSIHTSEDKSADNNSA